jgi:hypothetical protein
MVEVPASEDLMPQPVQRGATTLSLASIALTSCYALAVLRGAVRRLATTGEGGRHRALVREAAGLGRFVATGAVLEADARAALTAAAELAGMDDADEILRAISWGLRAGVPDNIGGQVS